jgi:hypothetical protein
MSFENLFTKEIIIENNLLILKESSIFDNQNQTNLVFSEKWQVVENDNNIGVFADFQKKWYLQLYGFKDENDLKN